MSESARFNMVEAQIRPSHVTDDRLLAVGMDGEAMLIDASADRFTPLGRMALIPDERGVYAHPAVVGTRLYYRGSDRVVRAG